MSLIEQIKEHEGFREFPYICPTGHPTIGYGTKLPLTGLDWGILLSVPQRFSLTEKGYKILAGRDINKFYNEIEQAQQVNFPTYSLSEEGADALIEGRLTTMWNQTVKSKPIIKELPMKAQLIIGNMTYQMGVGGVAAFGNMWRGLEAGDFNKAADEMLDSKWYREDSPERAQELADEMRSLA